MRRGNAVALALSLAMASSAAAIPSVTITAVTNPGTELAFADPEMDDSGLLAVIARTRHVSGLPCASRDQQRVVVLDLTSTCGQDVLREKPGLGTDPAISADGTLVAWRIESPGAHRLFVAPPDFASEVEVLPVETATAVKALQLSPDGTELVYWRLAGGVQQLVSRPALGSSPIVVLDQGDSIVLNDRHPMADDGTVFYSKLVGARHEIFMATPGQPGGTPVPGAWVQDDKLQVAANAAGDKVAWIGNFGGVDNVYWLPLDSDPVPLTFNTSASIRIFDLDFSRDGSTVVFSSNGDFTGGNFDGSVEIFRSDRIYTTGSNPTIVQLTDLTASFPRRPFIEGFSTNGIGGAVAASWGDFAGTGFEPCTASDHHTARVRLLPSGPPPPSFIPTNAMIMPPFDILTQSSGFSLGCVASGPSDSTCSVLVRGSIEGTRNILVMPRWDIAGCTTSTTPSPRLMTLPAASQAVVSAALGTPPGCSGQSATFTMVVVSPDVAVADRASATISYTLP